MKSIVVASCLLLTSCASPTFAAPPPCGPREDIAAKLLESYGEVPYGIGMSGGDPVSLTELFVNEDTGTYSILITSPEMFSCLLNSGSMWEFLDPATGDPL